MGDYRPKIEQRLGHLLARCALLLALALVQTALAPAVWGFRIDWVLVVVVCWTLLQGLAAGVRWALPGGLALDILSPLPFGSHLLGLLLAVTVVAVVTDSFPRDNRLLPTAAILAASLLYAALLALIMSMTGRPIAWARYPVTIMLPGALANGAMALPVYLLLERLSRGRRPDIGFET